MRAPILESALQVRTVDALSSDCFELSNGFFVYSRADTSDRSNIPFWDAFGTNEKVDSYAIIESQDDQVVDVFVEGTRESVNVSDMASLRALFPEGCNAVVDISGITHGFWASCLTALRQWVASLTYVFTEPSSYKFRVHPERVNPFDPTLFDLSQTTRGLRSLPGLLNLAGPRLGEQSIFVPLLGFEVERRSTCTMR